MRMSFMLFIGDNNLLLSVCSTKKEELIDIFKDMVSFTNF